MNKQIVVMKNHRKRLSMLIFLGIVGIVVAIIALVKGSFPLLGIKTRKVGVVVLVVSIIAFSAGVSPSDPAKETVSENKHMEQNDVKVNDIAGQKQNDKEEIEEREQESEISEESYQEVVLSLLRKNFGGIADVKIDRLDKAFLIIPTDEDYITELTMTFGTENPSEELTEGWDFVVESFVGMSESMSKTLPGYTIYHINPLNTDNFLLAVKDGMIIYNAAD